MRCSSRVANTTNCVQYWHCSFWTKAVFWHHDRSQYFTRWPRLPSVQSVSILLRPAYTGDFCGDFCGDCKLSLQTSADFMAISWWFVATKSLRFRTCSNFEAIYWRFFQFESNKNLLWCTPEGTPTWRTLLVTQDQKSRQKRRKLQRKQENLVALRRGIFNKLLGTGRLPL